MSQSEVLRDPGGLAITRQGERRLDQPNQKHFPSTAGQRGWQLLGTGTVV